MTLEEALDPAEAGMGGDVERDASSLPAPTALVVGPPHHDKLGSWELYRSIGSPRLIVAPMVDQSELVRRVVPASS